MRQTLGARASSFVDEVKAGNPHATWVTHNIPLLVLIPLTLLIAVDMGAFITTAAIWAIGGAAFNGWWAMHLRRGEHPPPGSVQSIATATTAMITFSIPEAGPLFIGLIFMGVGLSVVVGARTHAIFQSFWLYAAGYSLIGTDALTPRAWVIFSFLAIPAAYSAISFAIAELGHRERLQDAALSASGSTAWDAGNDGIIRSILGVGIPGIEVGTELTMIVHPDDERPATAKPGETLEYRVPNGDGGWRWIRESIDTSSTSQEVQRSAASDITDEKVARELDRERANLDQLTGLSNRANHIRTSREWAKRGTGSLIIVDLDDFKQINDTLGHTTGDLVLQRVAQRLTSSRRDIHVARLGGDEFAFMVNCDPEDTQQIASELVTRLIEPFSIESIVVYSGACAGFAQFEPGVAADEMRRRAGVALRQAKATGNTALAYDEKLEEESAKTKALAIELPSALANKDIVVHLQPKLDLLTETIVGYEALARWQHREHGLLEPPSFMDLISVSGLHSELYQIILEQALSHLALLRQGGVQVTVSVNLDARNLREPDLVSRTLGTIESYGLKPTDLVLELTEEALIGEDPSIGVALIELHEAGAILSIDDFGTGFSSLGYINRLPIRELKIDRSLVSQVTESPRAQAILEAIFGLSSRLGLVVVAEGIEDQETLDYLADQGCPQGQGYFIGHPEPVQHWIEESYTDVLRQAS